MKKVAIIITFILLIFSVSACGRPVYEHPITLEYRHDDGCVVSVIDYENDLVLELLNNGKWEQDTLGADYDYTLTFNGKNNRRTVFYNSEYGIFASEGLSLTVSEKNRLEINSSFSRNLESHIE